jgi:hypothetical protein
MGAQMDKQRVIGMVLVLEKIGMVLLMHLQMVRVLDLVLDQVVLALAEL